MTWSIRSASARGAAIAAALAIQLQIGFAADDAASRAKQAIVQGRYDEAERQASAALDSFAADDESAASMRARNLLVTARIKNGKAADSATVALAQLAVQHTERRFGRSDRRMLHSLHNFAALLRERGEFDRALTIAQRSLAIDSRIAADNRLRADLLDETASILIALERFRDARTAITRSLAIREHDTIDGSVDLAQTLGIYGLLEREAGEYAHAAALLERAIGLWEQSGLDHPGKASALASRGDVFYLTGDIANAERAWTEALDVGRRTLRPGHPALAAFLRHTADAQFVKGRLGDARRTKDEALQLGRATLAPCAPELSWLVTDLGVSLHADGDYNGAEDLYRQALDTAERCSRGTSTVATAAYNLASVASARGDLLQADALGRRAMQIWSTRLGATHPFVARALDMRADTATARREYVPAMRLLRQALAIRRTTLGPMHPQVGWNLRAIADIQARSGEPEVAKHTVTEAIRIFNKSPKQRRRARRASPPRSTRPANRWISLRPGWISRRRAPPDSSFMETTIL